LGTGIARLRIPLAPEEQGLLQPLVQDAGVYLNCDYPVIANIAMFSGPRINPPASIEISGPESLAPGAAVPLRLTVKNDLPTGISNVIVTSLMPQGLMAEKLEAAAVPAENLKIIDAGEDGQLVAAFLDELASGDELTLFMTVAISEDALPGTQMRNTATLFYRESAADQDWFDFTIGSAAKPEPVGTPAIATPAAVTVAAPTPTPETGPLPAAASDSGSTEIVSPPAETAEEGAEFVPPGKLPGTGGDFVSSAEAPSPPVETAEESADFVPPGKLPGTGGDFVSSAEAASPPVETAEESADFAPPGTGGDFVGPVEVASPPAETAEESADFAPPGKLPDLSEDFIIPPDSLPVTGQNGTLIFGVLPQMGLVPISVLIGLGLGGLLSVYRHLYPSRRDSE
jgi:hypothetical protein